MPGDPAALWVNVLVAIGTMAAAGVAVWGASQARGAARDGLKQARHLAAADRQAAIELAVSDRRAAAELAASEREHQRDRDFAERQYDREREALRLVLENATVIGESLLTFIMTADRIPNSPEPWRAQGVLQSRLALQHENEWPIARRIAANENRQQNGLIYCQMALAQYGVTTSNYVSAVEAEVSFYVSRAGRDLGEHNLPAGPT